MGPFRPVVLSPVEKAGGTVLDGLRLPAFDLLGLGLARLAGLGRLGPVEDVALRLAHDVSLGVLDGNHAGDKGGLLGRADGLLKQVGNLLGGDLDVLADCLGGFLLDQILHADGHDVLSFS